MSTKYIVNNLSGQTINGQSIDPKYKVYTALLSQSGGDNVQTLSAPNSLTIGVTYFILQTDTGCDFTNVGAPNNDYGTYFVATGTTPNSWGESDNAALEYNLGAPVVTVLENTIGNIWFTYFEEGKYVCLSNNLFTVDKTTIDIDAHGQNGNSDALIFNTTLNDDIKFSIYVYKGMPVDDMLQKNRLEIRVYN